MNAPRTPKHHALNQRVSYAAIPTITHAQARHAALALASVATNHDDLARALNALDITETAKP